MMRTTNMDVASCNLMRLRSAHVDAVMVMVAYFLSGLMSSVSNYTHFHTGSSLFSTTV